MIKKEIFEKFKVSGRNIPVLVMNYCGGNWAFEEAVSNFFKGRGYVVIRPKDIWLKNNVEDNVPFKSLFEKTFKQNSDKFYKLFKMGVAGVPDFLIYKGEELFLVEVKSKNDGIRLPQIKFIDYLNKIGVPSFFVMMEDYWWEGEVNRNLNKILGIDWCEDEIKEQENE